MHCFCFDALLLFPVQDVWLCVVSGLALTSLTAFMIVPKLM